jgi:hypothetical protein
MVTATELDFVPMARALALPQVVETSGGKQNRASG